MPRAFSLLTLLILTLAVRLAFVNTAEQYPYIDDAAGDSRPYRERAAEIRAGDLVGDEIYFDAPLYPYFLAMTNGHLGGSELAPKIAQAILDTATAFLVYSITRLLFGAGPGMIALVLYALYGMLVFYNGLLLKPVLALFLLTSSVRMLLSALQPHGDSGGGIGEASPTPGNALPTPGRAGRNTHRLPLAAILSGFLLGLSVLVRGNFLLVLPVHSVALWRLAGRRAAVAAIIAVMIPIASVTVRNYAVGRDFVPLTYHAGPTFYHGNNPRSDGTYKPILPGRQNPVYEKSDAIRLAEEAEGRSLRPSEISRYWFKRAFDHIASDVPAFLKLTGKRAALFWHPYEIPDTYDFNLYRSLFPLLAFGFVSFGLIAPLGLVGMFFPGRLTFRQSIPAQVVVAIFLSLVFLFVFGRYRLPAVPFLIPAAARALHGLGGAIQQRQWRRFATGFGATLSLAFLFSLTPAPRDETTGLYNLGIRMERLGRFAEAEALYRDAVEREPGFGSGWNNLGGVLLQSGAVDDAVAAFERAIQSDGGHFLANRNLARVLRDRRDWDRARLHYDRAYQTDPRPDLALDRGALEERAGDRGAAMAWYGRAFGNANVLLPEAALNLGRLLFEDGRNAEAASALSVAVDGLPGDMFPVALEALNTARLDPAGSDAVIASLRATIGGTDSSLPNPPGSETGLDHESSPAPPADKVPARDTGLLHITIARLQAEALRPDSALAAISRSRAVPIAHEAAARYLAGHHAHDWGFPDPP